MADLRRVALLAGVLGQLSVAVAGVLPWAALPLVVALFVACALASARAGESRARVLRGIATAGSLVLLLLTLPVLTPDRDGLRTSLGLLLIGVQVVHSLTWRARRDLETALLVAAALLVLGASFAPDVLVGLPLVAGWAAVVAGAVLAAGQRGIEGTAGIASGGSRTPVATATALAVVLGVAGFLLVPVEPTPEQRNPLAALAAGAGGVARGNQAYSASRLDMRIRGTLSERPVLEVPSGSPTLWRAGVYPFYDGLSWASRFGGTRSLAGPPYVADSTDRPTRTDRAVLRTRSDGTVWVPGETVSLEGDISGDVVSDDFGGLRVRGSLEDYRVTSAPQELDPAVLRAAPQPESVSPLWLQLPRALPDRVRALSAQLTAGAPTTYDAVTAVEDWLRSNATYQLDSPVPGRGEDAVDRFLFVDRVGFCEQFAAAETVLLRAAGIPARLATGLAYGVPAGDGRRLYREKDLHAWVEVFYPGVGWAPSDPTAGVQLAAGGVVASVRQRLVSAVEGVLLRAERVPGGRPALAVALVLVALAVVLLTGRLRRPRRAPALTSGAAALPARAGPALSAFLRYDARLGSAGRRPSESLAELSRRLGPAPAGALAVVEEECYAATPPPQAEEAAQVLDRL